MYLYTPIPSADQDQDIRMLPQPRGEGNAGAGPRRRRRCGVRQCQNPMTTMHIQAVDGHTTNPHTHTYTPPASHHPSSTSLLPILFFSALLLLVHTFPLTAAAPPPVPDPITSPPPEDSDFWNQHYDINGQSVTLGQINNVLNQSRPNYFWGGEIACGTASDVCCPAYCCNVVSTVHDLQKPMDMSFREKQTGEK